MAEPVRRTPNTSDVKATDDEIERNIHFFSIRTETTGKVHAPFKAKEILAHIRSLPFETGERHWNNVTGKPLALWVEDEARTRFFRMQLGTLRKDGIPRITNSDGSQLEMKLDAGQWVTEPTHMVLFPPNAEQPSYILGVEYNSHGPRAFALEKYLFEKAPEVCPTFNLEPLVKGDLAARFQRIEDLTLIHMQLRRTAPQVIKKHDPSLAQLVTHCLDEGGSPTIALTFGPEMRKRKQKLPRKWLDFASWALKNSELRAHADSLVIKGLNAETAQTVALNLFKDDFIIKAKMVRGAGRSVESLSAYQAIEAAYIENRTEIQAAATLAFTPPE